MTGSDSVAKTLQTRKLGGPNLLLLRNVNKIYIKCESD